MIIIDNKIKFDETEETVLNIALLSIEQFFNISVKLDSKDTLTDVNHLCEYTSEEIANYIKVHNILPIQPYIECSVDITENTMNKIILKIYLYDETIGRYTHFPAYEKIKRV